MPLLVILLLLAVTILYLISINGNDVPKYQIQVKPKLDIGFEPLLIPEGMEEQAIDLQYAEFLIFDIETNDLPIDYDAPPTDLNNWPFALQISWMMLSRDWKLIKSKEYLLNQNVIIDPKASRVNKITKEILLEKGVAILPVLNEFRSDIEKSRYLVAHNMDFDFSVIQCEMIRNNVKKIGRVKKICTMKKGTSYCQIPGYGSRRYKYPKLFELFSMCYYNYDISEWENKTHSAAGDVLITALCLKRMIEGFHISIDDKEINKLIGK